VKDGTFREDLFFRLRVVEIHMPPLRERKNDLPLLATAFLKEFAAENGKNVTGISREAMETLLHYSWPGNVRELRTALEHAVVLARSETISVRDLPQNIRVGDDKELGGIDPLSASDLTITEAEKQLIIRALKETNGNRSEAARRIGMSRRTLHRKLHVYHLENL
jgi:DNA-binding NtrC family response regulator